MERSANDILIENIDQIKIVTGDEARWTTWSLNLFNDAQLQEVQALVKSLAASGEP